MNVNKTLKEVIVRGFKFGTSMEGLALQLDVPLSKVEQTIRQRLSDAEDEKLRAPRTPKSKRIWTPTAEVAIKGIVPVEELALINTENDAEK